jgi:anti-anti-sigma regulatory factor
LVVVSSRSVELPRTLAAHVKCVPAEESVDDSTDLTMTVVRGGIDYARVILRGRIDQHAAQRLRSELCAVLDSGARYLTVDFAGINSCDQNILDVLSWAACRASLQEGWLALDGVDHHIRFAAR